MHARSQLTTAMDRPRRAGSARDPELVIGKLMCDFMWIRCKQNAPKAKVECERYLPCPFYTRRRAGGNTGGDAKIAALLSIHLLPDKNAAGAPATTTSGFGAARCTVAMPRGVSRSASSSRTRATPLRAALAAPSRTTAAHASAPVTDASSMPASHAARARPSATAPEPQYRSTSASPLRKPARQRALSLRMLAVQPGPCPRTCDPPQTC